MNKGYKNMCAAAEMKHKREMYLKGMISRTQTLDKVTLALGKMGFTDDQFREFKKMYEETEKEFCYEILEDNDKELVYSTFAIDRALKQYVPEDMFVPYEERYNFYDI